MSQTQDSVYQSILNEVANICDHASLTGALQGGTAALIAKYNQILHKLESDEQVPSGVFTSLSSTASVDEIGVEARLLVSALPTDSKDKKKSGRDTESDPYGVIIALAPFARGEDLADMIRQRVELGHPVPIHVVSKLAPFIRGEDLSELMQLTLNKGEKSDSSAPDTEITTTELQRTPEFHPVPSHDVHPLDDPQLNVEEKLQIALKMLAERRD